jgi:hypothetical protein
MGNLIVYTTIRFFYACVAATGIHYSNSADAAITSMPNRTAPAQVQASCFY